MSALLRPLLLLIPLLVAHDFDHLVRQGVALAIVAPGLVDLAGAIVLVGLVARRHPIAPLGAVVIGFGTALGIFVLHVLPDPDLLGVAYAGMGADALSWALMLSPLVAAAVLGWRGLTVVRAREQARVAPGGRAG